VLLVSEVVGGEIDSTSFAYWLSFFKRAVLLLSIDDAMLYGEAGLIYRTATDRVEKHQFVP
jgi:hypothetical protein